MKKRAFSEDWPGQLYFIGSAEPQPVQLGYVTGCDPEDIEERRMSLQAEQSVGLTVLHAMPAYPENELAMRELLDPYRTRDSDERYDWSAANSILECERYIAARSTAGGRMQFLWNDTLYRQFADAIESEEGHTPECELTKLLLRQHLLAIVDAVRAPRLPLLGWLLLQENRDDPVGDLAEDAKRSPEPLRQIDTLIGYASRLPEHTWYAVAAACVECLADVSAICTLDLQFKERPWRLRAGTRVTL